MDEVEGVGDGVNIYHNAYMAYATSGTRAGEEYQVSTLHLATADGHVAGVLIAAGASDLHVAASEYIAGEARAVEGVGAFAATAIACTEVRHGFVHDIVDLCYVVVQVLTSVHIEEVEVVNLIAYFFLGLYFLDLMLLLHLAECEVGTREEYEQCAKNDFFVHTENVQVGKVLYMV